MTSKYYCADLHAGLYLDYRSATQTWGAAPCCEFRESYTVDNSINTDYWTNPKVIKLRQDNLSGQPLPDACVRCRETEASGNRSRRQGVNERFGTEWRDTDGVIESNFQADYSCNLACRICNSNLSTTWRKWDPDYQGQKIFKVRADQKNVAELFTTVKLENLRQIHFQGGEPLLSNTHMDVLERLQDHVDLKQVGVWYSSNGTVRASERTMKFWERLRLVEIYFSLDDIGSRFEYQRWPAQWAEVADNMIWYKSNIPHNAMLGVERTIGVLNVGWAHELDHWISDNFAATRYGDPIPVNYHYCSREYGLHALSQEYIDYVLKNVPQTHWAYRAVKNCEPGTEQDIKTMLTHLKKHDSVRNQDYRTVYPEFDVWYRRFL